MSQYSFPIGLAKIKDLIPHRDPFLLVDEVVSAEPGQRIACRKQVKADMPVFAGHFPGNPVFPGVYMIESMAQASAILGRLTSPEATGQTCLLMEVSQSRFRRMIKPGDLVDITVELTNRKSSFFWFKGEVKVGNELAASATFSAKLS